MKSTTPSKLSLIVLIALGATGTGCFLLPSSVLNVTARSADNPLKGTPVTWSRDAEGVPFEGQKACSVWPLQDELAVKATDTEICVDGKVHKLVASNFDGPSEASLSIESDGSGEEGLGTGQVDAVKAKTQKIGSCFDKATSQEKNVWLASYSSCVPNKNVTGKAVLTTKSTFLQVGDARWKFPTTEPAKPAEPAKTTAASSPSK